MIHCDKCGTDTRTPLCGTCDTVEVARHELEPHLDAILAQEVAEKITNAIIDSSYRTQVERALAAAWTGGYLAGRENRHGPNSTPATNPYWSETE